MTPTIRFFQPGDEPALVDHLLATFGRWPGIELSVPPVEHLRWKLGHDPVVSECSVVAEEGQRIVGALLFVGQRVRMRDGEWVAGHGADWSVQPAYQTAGLMVAMREFAGSRLNERVDYQPGQTDSERIMRYHYAMGYRHMANAVQRFAADLGNQANDGARSMRIATAAHVERRFDRLWAEAAPRFDYIGVRDARWLSRRYFDKPAGEFELLIAEDGGALLGYCVFRISRRRSSGAIADVLAVPGRVDVIEALVSRALVAFRRAGLETAVCWLPGRHAYRAAIESCGFAPRGKPVPTIYKALRAPPEAFAFLEEPDAAVHITMGDSDTV